MTLVGITIIPPDEAVRAYARSFGLDRLVEVPPGRYAEAAIARHAKGNHAMLFASPRRRWPDVIDALRAIHSTAAGEIYLRFAQPACTIAVNIRFSSGRYAICPLVLEFDRDAASKAYTVRKAVKEGLADLEAAETRSLVEQGRAVLEAARQRSAH